VAFEAVLALPDVWPGEDHLALSLRREKGSGLTKNVLQGPYYGQAVWFHIFHPESLPSAKARYEEQIHRVIQVLEEILKGKKYLLGDKL
jgi:hypothetical protein